MRFGKHILKKNRPARGWNTFLCGLFVCALLLNSSNNVLKVYAETKENLKLYATSAVLLDGTSGRVLYGKAEEEQMAMASTTKIMTCILVLENVDLEETAGVSAYAASMPQVKLNVRKGERYRIEDLLYSLMLESHNDTAVVLAEHIGRKLLGGEYLKKEVSEYSLEESKNAVKIFAGLMNQKARELGCMHTYFVTPNGLDGTEEIENEAGEKIYKEHMTTAKDLATIMKYCVGESEKSKEFLLITQRVQYSFSANNRFYSCSNHNAFLQMMDGVISGKTGFTNKAGYCYVGALRQGERTFIVALLACGWPNHKTYKWSDTKTLMQYGLDNYELRDVSEGSEEYYEKLLAPITVCEGQSEDWEKEAFVMPQILEASDKQTDIKVLMQKDEQVVKKCYLKKTLEAPVYAGSVVGKVDYCIDDKVYRQDVLVIDRTVLRIDFWWCLKNVLKFYLL